MGVGAAFIAVRAAALTLAAWLFYARIGPVHLTLHPKFTNELIRESLPLATLSVADRIKLYLPSIVLAYTAGEAAVGLFRRPTRLWYFPC